MTNALCFAAGWLLMDAYRAWRKKRERTRTSEPALANALLKAHGKCRKDALGPDGLRCAWPQCTPGHLLIHFGDDGSEREFRRAVKFWPSPRAGESFLEYSWVPR